MLLALAAPATAQLPPPAGGTSPGADGFDPNALPAVVATVDGTEITKAELIAEATGAQRQLAALGDERPMDRAFYAEALDQIVAGILIHDYATAQGFGATDEEVTAEIEKTKAQFANEDAFVMKLAQEGTSINDLQRDFRRQISISKYLVNVIRPTITITEEEIRTIYEDNLEAIPMLPEGVKVRHLLVAVPAEATEEQVEAARARAQGVLGQIEGGEDFGELIRTSSDDESAADGGELPWLGRGQTLPGFEDAAFALRVGETSGLVRSQVGFHIIESLDRRETRRATFEEMRPRIEGNLAQQRAQLGLVSRVEELKLQAEIDRPVI